MKLNEFQNLKQISKNKKELVEVLVQVLENLW